MLTRGIFWLVVLALVLLARPVLPQQSPDATATPAHAYGWDPARATIYASYAQATAHATARSSTRGYDPVMATFQAAYGAAATATPTPQTYTRGYDPLFITLQAWGDNAAATATPTPQTYTRGYDPLFITLQAWAHRPTATPTPAPCAWVSVNQPLDELTAQVQADIDAAGADGVTFSASAYGENCFDSAMGAVRMFLLRDVTYQLAVSGTDAPTLGAALASALPAVQRAVKTESRSIYQIQILFADADLDPVSLTPAQLDLVLSAEATGAALVARLYNAALR